MNAITGLLLVRIAVFLAIAILAAARWRRQPGRPAAFLAAAFGSLAIALLLATVVRVNGTAHHVVRDLVVIGVAAFPWLLAAFAWSFEPRLPRWLLWMLTPLIVMGVWIVFAPPFPQPGEPRDATMAAFTALFVATWSVLAVTAATRLWQAGGRQQLVRARMRSMASGALLLAGALLITSILRPTTDRLAYASVVALSLVAAVAFVLGFTPSASVRGFWRRRAARDWHDAQTALLGAVTPQDVADAVAHPLAELVGGGVAVVARPDVEVLSSVGIDGTQLAVLERRLAEGQPLPDGAVAVEGVRAWLVVQVTPYTPVFGEDERVMIRGVALQTEIALERAELYQRTLRSREELESILVGIAHDLRSPTTAISGFATYLREDPDCPDRDEVLATIAASTDYLHRLVEALYQLGAAGGIPDDVQEVDLHVLVESACARLAATHPRATVTVAGRLPVVHASPLRMEQVVDNLLTNAAKHAGRDDVTITVRAEQLPSEVRIVVADDGNGIPRAERDTVFVPFHRGRATTSPGSGVGLGLVKRIVEGHGGDLRLLDTDRGASFQVTLPTRGVLAGS